MNRTKPGDFMTINLGDIGPPVEIAPIPHHLVIWLPYFIELMKEGWNSEVLKIYDVLCYNCDQARDAIGFWYGYHYGDRYRRPVQQYLGTITNLGTITILIDGEKYLVESLMDIDRLEGQLAWAHAEAKHKGEGNDEQGNDSGTGG